MNLVLHAPDSTGDETVRVTLLVEPGQVFDSAAESINVRVR